MNGGFIGHETLVVLGKPATNFKCKTRRGYVGDERLVLPIAIRSAFWLVSMYVDHESHPGESSMLFGNFTLREFSHF